MKRIFTGLSVVLMTMLFAQQTEAQDYYNNSSNRYDDRYYNRYDLSDYLDLEAVASVFAASRTIDDFENRLNDYRNQVSNLDLNNDGYVDYLRVVKLYDRNAHVILIQAVLGNNYYQDVATITVERDAYYRDYIQIVGDPYLYGNDYILEPVYNKRPKIVKWLWSRPHTVYVSRYYWGYYPHYFRMRPILPMHHYFNHLRVFVDVHHRYHYTTRVRFPVYVDIIRHHRRNDYWRDHHDQRFEQRNRDYKNKGYFEYNQERRKPDVRERDVRHSENNRRQSNPGVAVPRRDTRMNPSENRPAIPQRETRVTLPKNTSESQQRDVRVTQPRNQRVTPPQRDTRSTESREIRVNSSSKESRVAPKTENKWTSSRDVKVNSSSKETKAASKTESRTASARNSTRSDDSSNRSGRR
ncbi:MAG: hypothetical protein PHZ12_05345 [Paludibacter sp.]|nr:hypothetical protein [Paludibacter sp.]